MSRGPWIDHFGDNFLWSNATLILKGMAPYGVVALEEMDRACERLRARQNEPQAWTEEWRALGNEIEQRLEARLEAALGPEPFTRLKEQLEHARDAVTALEQEDHG